MVKIVERMLRLGEGRTLKRLAGLADQVNALEEEYVALGDAELRAETDAFKARVADGESLDSLLPEAFAVVREAAKRTLGQRHFDVQLMGGAALHLGNIAEMKPTSTRCRARASTSSPSTTTWRPTSPS